MKRAIILLMFFVPVFIVKAQHFSSLKDIKIDTKESCEEYVDQVFDCCCYLLQTPFDKRDNDRQLASGFIARWIKGSSEDLFKVDDNIKALIEDREELVSLYITCYTKEYIENEDIDIGNPELKTKAINTLFSYCSKSMNKIKLTKEMKELMELKNSGEVASVDQYFMLKNSVN